MIKARLLLIILATVLLSNLALSVDFGTKREYFEMGANTYFGSYSTRIGGQTFTVGTLTPGDFNLTMISLNVRRTGAPGFVTVSLYETSGGFPIGIPLVSNSNVDANTFSATYSWENISMPGYILKSGTRYAIVIEHVSSGSVEYPTNSNGGYDGGDCIDNLGGGWIYCGGSAGDNYFEVWGTDILNVTIDTDGDGIPDSLDNCPYAYNPGQEDSNNNGIGDACDIIPTNLTARIESLEQRVTYLEQEIETQKNITSALTNIVDNFIIKIITYLTYLPQTSRESILCGYLQNTNTTSIDDLGLHCSITQSRKGPKCVCNSL